MSALIPINKSIRAYDDFYNVLDDFFNDAWAPRHSLLRDTFKLDVKETETVYLIEAEMPGVKKEEINLNIENEVLCISVTREENIDQEGKDYIHKERRTSSMSRNIRLANVKPDEIKATLEQGVLTVMIPKLEKADSSHKIDIE